MQKFKRIEIKWIIQALEHTISGMENAIDETDSQINRGLLKLRSEQLTDIVNKLNVVDKSKDKRISIE